MNISGIDLNLLPVFDALLTERSVTRAATKVGLSQPALSNALTRLRACFDDRLFVRTGGAMVPTPRAMELAPEIQAALTRVQAAFQSPVFNPANLERQFRLATSVEIEMVLFPAVMKELSKIAPGVSVSCTRIPGTFVVPEVELQLGTLDAAIGLFPKPVSVESGRLTARLYRPQYVCIARAGHPALKSHLTLKRYCQLNHVVPFFPAEGPGLIDRLLAQKGYKRRVKLYLPHFLPIPFVVAGSDLIATVPTVVARAMAKPLRLQSVQCPVVIPQIHFSLIWHTRTEEDPSHKWFRSVVLRVAENLGSHKKTST